MAAAALMASWQSWESATAPVGDVVINWAGPPIGGSPTAGWLLVDFPSALAVVLGYLSFVVIGSLMMKVLPGDGFKFPGLSFAYNITQMMLCSYMCIEALLLAKRSGYSLVCNQMATVEPPLAKLLHLFHLSKVLDFADTFFIVLGKKWRQLSFLHVYHHATIFSFYWLNANVNYDGDIYLTVFLNGAIHTMMYTYYFLSIHTRDIWWKKYMTSAQLVQFVCMIAQSTTMLVRGEECSNVPHRVVAVYLGYIISLFALFMHFYLNSYTKPSKAKGDKAL